MKVILASNSPRRKEILENLGMVFEVFAPETDEKSEACAPDALVRELALRKANASRGAYFKKTGENPADNECLTFISADTVVFSKESGIFGKPKNAEDAKRMLRALSGCEHTVYTGVCVANGKKLAVGCEATKVFFADMTPSDIDFYVSSGEANGKAGAYAIQGLASIWIKKIEGCYFNVMGLPVRRLYETAKEAGVDLPALCKKYSGL